MKVVILCGGQGTRLREETEYRPKPMVSIGGRPILWHIMKHFSFYGHQDFYCALGYKGELIKAYFLQYHGMEEDVSVNIARGEVSSHSKVKEDWNVHMISTGLKTNTAGRIRRLRKHLGDEPFLLAYGDSVSTVNLDDLLAFHKRSGKVVTLTAVRPPSRFGELDLKDELVVAFDEKPPSGKGWINGGFMVIEPQFFDYIEDDDTGLEILTEVAKDKALTAFRHEGHWQCMDTIRDRERLEEEWASGAPPWVVWA